MADKGASKSRAHFVYEGRDPEALRERLRRYDSNIQFHDAILCAYRGDTQPLRDLLQSNTQLSSESREMLAALIRWGIEPKQGRGRPRGSVPVLNPARENERLIADRVRKLKLRQFGRERVPRGELNALIDQVMQQMNNDDLLEGGASKVNVRNELKRGTRQKGKPSSTAPRRK
jgi:hypothetical protein